MNNSLLRVSAGNDGQQSKPTVRQWLRTISKNTPIAKAHPVMLIWKAGTFACITVETEYYKVRIYEDSPLFEPLKKMLWEWYCSDAPVAISLDEDRSGSYEFVRLDKENVEWSELGDRGYKLNWKDIPEPKKNVTTKKPVELKTPKKQPEESAG